MISEILTKLDYGQPLSDKELLEGIKFFWKMEEGLRLLNYNGFYEFALRDVMQKREVLERFKYRRAEHDKDQKCCGKNSEDVLTRLTPILEMIQIKAGLVVGEPIFQDRLTKIDALARTGLDIIKKKD